MVGPPVDGAELTERPGVAGTWQFADRPNGRHVTVAFVDGNLWAAAGALGPQPGRRARPNGPDRWSESMPTAGTGSLR